MPSTLSKFSNRGRDVALGIRERYLWSWFPPPEDDPVFKQLSGQFRAELHDRFLAPVYPFAFAVLTFAFLGTPRTTRQSRNFRSADRSWRCLACAWRLRLLGDDGEDAGNGYRPSI